MFVRAYTIIYHDKVKTLKKIYCTLTVDEIFSGIRYPIYLEVSVRGIFTVLMYVVVRYKHYVSVLHCQRLISLIRWTYYIVHVHLTVSVKCRYNTYILSTRMNAVTISHHILLSEHSKQRIVCDIRTIYPSYWCIGITISEFNTGG